MCAADVVICVTEHSLTHTKARKRAVKGGGRVATMPGLTLDMLSEGAITADYDEAQSLTERVSAILDAGKTVVIEKNGERLTFAIDGQRAMSSTGMFTQKGQSATYRLEKAILHQLKGQQRVR